MAEQELHHIPAPALPMLQHHDRHPGWRHPRHEVFQMCQPLLRRNVIERMGAEHQIARRTRSGGQDRPTDRLDGWEHLLQLLTEIDVWLDGNGALKCTCEGLDHFTIPLACIDEDAACR